MSTDATRIWVQAPFTEGVSGTGKIDGVFIDPGQAVCWHITADSVGKGFISGYTIIQRKANEQITHRSR